MIDIINTLHINSSLCLLDLNRPACLYLLDFLFKNSRRPSPSLKYSILNPYCFTVAKPKSNPS